MTSRLPPLAAALLALLLTAVSGHAQPAALVADLAAAGGAAVGSNPAQFTRVRGGRFVFTATEPSSGEEIWGSDGTAAGTRLLTDSSPGPAGSGVAILGTWSGAALFTTFVETSTSYGESQIWRTDGTPEGTVPLRGTGDGAAPLQASGDSAVLGGFLYFMACSKAQCGIWRTDGTQAGTRLAVPMNGSRLVATDRILYFTVQRSTFEPAYLWRTDGTAAGTVRLATFGDAIPRAVAAVGSKVFFAAYADTGEELWVSDGTRAGTRPLTSFGPLWPFGGYGGGPAWLFPVEGGVAFPADTDRHGREIWRSDGTPEGTRRLTEFAVRDPFQGDFEFPPALVELRGRLLVAAFDGTGWSLWVADGRSMTRLHTCLGGCADRSSTPPALVTHGNRALFVAGAGQGQELWRTDGTAAGTHKLLDACAGTGPCASTIVLAPWRLDGREVFKVAGEGGDQLWTTDGTSVGTRRLFHLPPGTKVGALPVDLGAPGSPGSKIAFGAADKDGMELWMSEDGQERQVANLASDAAGSSLSMLTASGSQLIFQAGSALWQSAGTAATTSPLLASFSPEASCNSAGCSPLLAAADGWLAVVQRGSGGAEELWRTDGTAAGTFRLLTVEGPVWTTDLATFQGIAVLFVGWESHVEIWRSDGTPEGTFQIAKKEGVWRLCCAGGTGTEVYFQLVTDSVSLWRTDGTVEGTIRVASLPPSGDNETRPVRVGDRVFLAVSGQTAEEELWSTDGTEAGTVKVAAGLWGLPITLKESGGQLYIVAYEDDNYFTFNLWRSDGTAAGTAVLLRSSPHRPTGLTDLGGRLFFAAGDFQDELWTSDGTPAGTRPLRDTNPEIGSRPSAFAVLGDRLYFSAFDPEHGFELWSTDGTAGGTHLVQDIAPGRFSSSPDQLTVVGDRLYFTADDGATGRELWSLH
jgi:ELWxxDGT repeat protein